QGVPLRVREVGVRVRAKHELDATTEPSSVAARHLLPKGEGKAKVAFLTSTEPGKDEGRLERRPSFTIGAQERTRTSTELPPLAPEASASTNSATWAGVTPLCELREPRNVGIGRRLVNSFSHSPNAPCHSARRLHHKDI